MILIQKSGKYDIDIKADKEFVDSYQSYLTGSRLVCPCQYSHLNRRSRMLVQNGVLTINFASDVYTMTLIDGALTIDSGDNAMGMLYEELRGFFYDTPFQGGEWSGEYEYRRKEYRFNFGEL